MPKRVLAVLSLLALIMTGLVGASEPALARVALPGKELTVAPTYDGLANFTVNTLEYHDSLPDYQLTVTDLGTGQSVPLGFGYAPNLGDGDFESDYNVTSSTPLTVGSTYQVYFHLDTQRFWHCSIYDPDGCSFLSAEHTTSLWRFTYQGAKQTATPYTMTTKLDLGRKAKYHAHGWRITVTLTGDGMLLPGAEIVGQFRRGNHGRWQADDTYRTDRNGKVALHFNGEDQPTTYRFQFEGSEITSKATSRSFSIHRR